MTYTGEVTVGGPAALRRLDEVDIRKLAVGPAHNNAYLLTARGGAQVLIDAAADPSRLTELVRQGSGSGRLDAIVTTHSHPDHVQALRPLAEATGAQVVAGAPDADAVEKQTGVVVDRRVGHGDVVDLGGLKLDVVALRGHTDGSIALAYREPAGAAPGRVHLFSGDSLFPGGVGNTWGDADRFASLFADVTARVFDRFDDDTWVYPGHGDDTTLERERPSIPEWLARGW